MPTSPGDASVNDLDDQRIPSLAELYDKFAHSLDPFSQARDEAEAAFQYEVVQWYDSIKRAKPPFREFRRGVISRCKRYLAANDRPQDKGLLGGLDNPPSPGDV
jgi:hypothetical protein